MKNKIIGTATLALAAVLFTVNAQPASAAAGGSTTTEGTVKIKQHDAPLTPLNPLDPKKSDPKDPGKGDGSKGVGSEGLYLDYVSNFRFKEVTLDPEKGNETMAEADKWTYQTKNKPAVSVPNHLQVSDKRLVKGTWNIKVAASEMKSVDAGSKTILAGAKVTLKNVTVKDLNGRDDAALKTVIGKGGKAATGGADIDISTDGKDTLVLKAADAADARGTFIASFNEQDPANGVALNIPVQKDTIKNGEQFKTTLKWTLSDTPA